MTDPAPPPAPGGDVFRSGRGPLAAIFEPRGVAVVGATDRAGSVGRAVLRNLLDGGFGGAIHPVNPGRAEVLGIRAYPSIGAVPGAVDLAVIATPAGTVPGLVGECAEAGVGGVVVLSAGFKETGPGGVELEFRALERARAGGVRLIGPNSLGVIRPAIGLNASLDRPMPRAGGVGFLSQSGALASAVLDWAREAGVGFSAVVSAGSMLDVGWGDLIDHLGDDPMTRSIVIFMESVGDARAFLSAAREVAPTRPILVVKAGRTEAAARAAATHTGALAGPDEVLDAAFRRAGVLRVGSIAEAFAMAGALAGQPRPRGPRLAILTNSGAAGVLAVDALIGSGGRLAGLSDESLAALDALLPPHWGREGPVDLRGDAGPDRYARALGIAARDPGVDGLLAILTPQDPADPTATAEALGPLAQAEGKPVLASWMGGAGVAAGRAILGEAGIPTFPDPDAAARAFAAMARHAEGLRDLRETPDLPPEPVDEAEARARGDAILRGARDEGRALLDEFESKQLLAAHGLPTVETRVAVDEDGAVEAAGAIGYPVVVKLYSRTIAHKAEVGGVRLGLVDAHAVREAYRNIAAAVDQIDRPGAMLGVTVQPMVRLEGVELILGAATDPQFGPVLLLGPGGRLAGAGRDRALALPPLTATLARRLMERTRIFEALRGARGRRPVDLEALERILVRFARMLVERPRIKEVDINPLLASPEGILALDARVILHDDAVPDEQVPRAAIRPYPGRYAAPWVARDGSPVVIRPIRPEDEPLLARFHADLAEHPNPLRPPGLSRRVAADRLARICSGDYDREMALVVDHKDPWAGAHAILGIGRLRKARGGAEAEFALLVADRHRCHGIGTELLRRLLDFARDEAVARVAAEFPADRREARRVSEKLGFRLEPSGGGATVRATIDLA